MVFEKHLRQKQIEKEAIEAASKSVNDVLSSSYMRSEFEKNRYWIGLFKTDVEFNGLLGEFGTYELNGSRDVNHSYLEDFNSKWEAYAKAWQHQQYKMDDLQRRNHMLNENIKEQGQKLVYQNEVIETQAEKLLGLRDEKAGLLLLYVQQGVNMFKMQKRLDAALDVVKQGISKQGSNYYLEKVEELLEGGE